MSIQRVLVLSDSHLSPRAPEAAANWAAISATAGAADLVVHAGDLTLNGAEGSSDMIHARRLLDELPVPWVAVPGNHDIGDNVDSSGPVIDEDRIDRWRTFVGADYWAVEIGDWTVVGINAQLFGSGIEAEAEQWIWLEERLRQHPPGRPVVLVIHKPLVAGRAEMTTAPAHRFIPSLSRRRLGSLLDAERCPVVVSGHVHQFRIIDDGRRLQVWAPTTWAVLPEAAQRSVGLKRCGALWLSLASDGTARCEFLEPAGLAQLTLVDDIPDPYHS